MKFSARFIFIFLLLTTYYLLLTTPALAQAPNPYTVPNTNPDVPKNLHTWTQNVMIEVMSAMSCQLSGIDPTDPKSKCLGVDSKTGNIGYVEGGGGAIGVAGKMIAMLYTPPLHTGDYFKYLASNFGIAKPAYAAGFEGLKPVQKLWVAFRNIVYLLFVIIFIVIGLAIMLRVRIDPRTVMTIQNQIPKIIIGILLVTFSFAIAGFLIDLMYVVIFLSYELISGAVTGTDFSKLNPLTLQGQTAIGAAGNIGDFRGLGGVAGIAGTAAGSITAIVTSLFALDDLLSATSVIIHLISVGFGTFMGIQAAQVSTGSFLGSGLPGWTVFPVALALYTSLAEVTLRTIIPNILFFLIIFIALLIALFRLWFVLIMAYISILLNVVFAPFWIAGALLPGSPIGFTAWLRSIIANLAAFPAVIIMFLLARAFIEGFGSTQTSDQFVPPLIGDPGSTDAIGALIGLGIILMTPNVVAMVKAALKAPSVPAAGILAGITAGSRVVGGVPRGIGGTYMASQEWIQTGVSPTGAPTFGQRRTGRALLGRFFGR